MKNRNLIHQVIAIALTFLLLTACGGSGSGGTGGALPASKSVNPEPGAAITANINTGEKASSGTLSFKVSDDGTALTNLSIGLKDANCNNMISMGSVMDSMSDPGITITDGKFEGALSAMGGMVTDYRFNPGDSFPTPVPNPDSVGKIVGQFTSPTTASGTITIYLGAMMSGGVVCELGTFDWSSP